MGDKRLEMIFATAGGSRSTISLDEPLDDLDQATVQAAMQTIIDKNIFATKTGALTGINAARIVTREVTELI